MRINSEPVALILTVMIATATMATTTMCHPIGAITTTMVMAVMVITVTTKAMAREIIAVSHYFLTPSTASR